MTPSLEQIETELDRARTRAEGYTAVFKHLTDLQRLFVDYDISFDSEINSNIEMAIGRAYFNSAILTKKATELTKLQEELRQKNNESVRDLLAGLEDGDVAVVGSGSIDEKTARMIYDQVNEQLRNTSKDS